MFFKGFKRSDRYDSDRPPTKQPRPGVASRDGGPPVSLPPGSGDLCRCSKCVKGISTHECSKCGCINEYRWIPLPAVTPNWVASTDDYWEEFTSSAARFFPVHLLHYEEACIWRTAEFNGPPYNPGDGSVMDRYQLELDYNAETPYLNLVRTVDNGAPLIELEWCLADICGETMCLCPWFFRLKKWANVFPIEECQICVTPRIPLLQGQQCSRFDDCGQPMLMEVAWAEFTTTTPVGLVGHRVGVTEFDPDRSVLYPLDHPEGDTVLPVVPAETGAKIHFPWMPIDGSAPNDDAWFASLIVGGVYESNPNSVAITAQVGCGIGTTSVFVNILWQVDEAGDPGTRYVVRQIFTADIPNADMCTEEHTLPSDSINVISSTTEGDLDLPVGTAFPPSITMRFVDFETDVPPTSGDEPCGTCDDEQCVIVVDEVEGSGNRWIVDEESTCTLDCDNQCYIPCGQEVIHDIGGDANDFSAGHKVYIPCLSPLAEGTYVVVTFGPLEGGSCLCGTFSQVFCLNEGTGRYEATLEFCGETLPAVEYYESGGTWYFSGIGEGASNVNPAGPFNLGFITAVPLCEGLQATVAV